MGKTVIMDGKKVGIIDVLKDNLRGQNPTPSPKTSSRLGQSKIKTPKKKSLNVKKS